MDPVLASQLIIGVNEAAKLGLQLWLAHQHMQGKDSAQIKESFDTELIEYKPLDPTTLVKFDLSKPDAPAIVEEQPIQPDPE
jgi:hypothetical protein